MGRHRGRIPRADEAVDPLPGIEDEERAHTGDQEGDEPVNLAVIEEPDDVPTDERAHTFELSTVQSARASVINPDSLH